MIVGFRHLGGPENECNPCWPAIQDTLYVTLANQVGDLAAYNGKHEVTWRTGCVWYVCYGEEGFMADESVVLYWRVDPTHIWQVYCVHKNPPGPGGDCIKGWRGQDGQACDPDGAYAEDSCNAAGCDDPDTCTGSAGATCVVSLT